MKIYDCFQFFDEEMLLDLRLNIMDKYVDKFVITEAKYSHNGKPKKLFFDISKFSKFKDKIIYIVVDKDPPDLLKININENQKSRDSKEHSNAYRRHIFQLEETRRGISNADADDLIIVGDLDEIPNLEKTNFNLIKEKLIFFEQKMFYYKFNLYYKMIPWYGTKACRKKHLISTKWIQWIKNKKYPLWRIDILFSKKKYNNIHFVTNGGWHFTNIKSAEDIEKKLKSFVHYKDFESSDLQLDDLKKLVEEKKVMYNHKIDKKGFKWTGGEKLETLNINQMPKYIQQNHEKYKLWLDNI
jgi:beta-1,4-mannosyl-glycoprotein beta-1,4-N-acetylglucosaminyltransferase